MKFSLNNHDMSHFHPSCPMPVERACVGAALTRSEVCSTFHSLIPTRDWLGTRSLVARSLESRKDIRSSIHQLHLSRCASPSHHRSPSIDVVASFEPTSLSKGHFLESVNRAVTAVRRHCIATTLPKWPNQTLAMASLRTSYVHSGGISVAMRC